MKSQDNEDDGDEEATSQSTTQSNDNELHLFHARITSIAQVKSKFPHVNTVESLNLHGNRITRIQYLTDFIYLKELDLSSNDIARIEGLSMLRQLQVLNLASNKISVIEGLVELKELRKLVLAYNQITSLSGLTQLHGDRYSIESIDLRGNQIKLLRELGHFKGCRQLREIFLQYKGKFANPVCSLTRYQRYIASKVPNLELLDGNSLTKNVSDSVRFYPALYKYAHLFNDSPSVNPPPTQEHRSSQDGNNITNEEHKDQNAIEDTKQSNIAPSIQVAQCTQTSPVESLTSADSTGPTVSFAERFEVCSISSDYSEDYEEEEEVKTPALPIYISEGIQTDLDPFDKYIPCEDKSVQVNTKVPDSHIQRQLQTLLDNSKEEQIQLQSQLERLCQELGSSKVYIQKREEELATEITKKKKIAKHLTECRDEREELQNQLKEERNSTVQLRAENEQLREHCSHLKEEIAETRLELEQVKNQISMKHVKQQTTYDMNIKGLNEELNEVKSKYSKILKEYKGLCETAEKQKTQFENSIQQQSQLHNAEVTAMMQRQNEELERRESVFNKQLKEKEDSIIVLYQTRIDELSSVIASDKKKREELEIALCDATNTISDLKAILKEYMTKDMHLTALNSELSDVVKQQKKKLNQLLKEKHEKARDIQEMQKSYEFQIEQVNQRLKNRVPVLEQENLNLKDVIEKNIKTIQYLEKRVSEADAVTQTKITELNELNAKMDNLNATVNQLRSDIAELNQQLALKDVIIADNNMAIQEYRQNSADVKRKEAERCEASRRIKKELNEAMDRIEELEHQLSEVEAYQEDVRTKLQVGKLKRQKLREVIEEKNHLLEQREEEYNRNYEQLQDKLKETERKYSQKLQVTQSLVDQTTRELEENKKTSEQTKAAMHQAAQDTQKLIDLAELLKDKLRRKDMELESLHKALQHQKQQTVEAEDKLSKLTTAFNAIR